MCGEQFYSAPIEIELPFLITYDNLYCQWKVVNVFTIGDNLLILFKCAQNALLKLLTNILA